MPCPPPRHAPGLGDAPLPARTDARSLARCALHFVDAQEQALALSGWNQRYLQLSAGCFQGELDQVQGPGIRLFIERVQQSVLQNGQLPPGVLALGVPLQASGSGVFCGRPCDLQSLHLFSGRQGFAFRTSRQHTMLGLELQRDDVASLTHSAGTLAQAAGALGRIKPYVLALYQQARRDPQLLHNPAVVASVADFLVDQLSGQSHPRHARSDAVRAHWGLVQACMARVQADASLAPTVTQLCQEMGVSRRTLQNAFARVLDMSPLAYVKALRLRRARERLERAHSVTEAATACGFWHFGHFAHDYLALFGERPSDTLRRAASQPSRL